MAETRKDILEQIDYMQEHKHDFLCSENPQSISFKEYEKRIQTLKESL